MAKNVAYFEDTSGSSNKFYLMVEDTSNATFTATWGGYWHGRVLKSLSDV